jgi:hypothetical protein
MYATADAAPIQLVSIGRMCRVGVWHSRCSLRFPANLQPGELNTCVEVSLGWVFMHATAAAASVQLVLQGTRAGRESGTAACLCVSWRTCS